MQKIGIEEQHKRLLAIAKIFDEICSRHNIPYYMLGGTMLGAIRHKGFIPWDDDMDFGVPRPYYKKLQNVLEKELPTQYVCCTFETREGCYSPIMKIEDSYTCINDPRVPLPLEKQLGLNVDIFPLDYFDEGSSVANAVTKMAKLYSIIYIDNSNGNIVKNIIKRVLRILVPFDRVEYLRKMNRVLEKCSRNVDANLLSNTFGRWQKKEWVPKEWYGSGVRFQFDCLYLVGIHDYDKYLSRMYGNYLSLPPEEMRIPHADNVYLK